MDKVGIQDVINNDLCVGCGACVSESANIKGMIWDDRGFLIPDIDRTHDEDQHAIKVCPFSLSSENKLLSEDNLAEKYFKEAPFYDGHVGRYFEAYVGFSKSFRENSSSGGIATFIFEQLLRKKVVDSIFAVKELNGTYSYQFFDDLDNIQKISKTRYIPVSLVELFERINNLEGKVAVAGVACFVKAIRLKQELHPELKDKIPFVIGIICGGLKSKFFTDYLAQKAKIREPYKNQDYRIKDAASLAHDYSFGAFGQDNIFNTIKMRSLGDMWGTGLFKSNACDFCYDVTTELADISLGDAWIEPYMSDGRGNSVILTRSVFANELIKNGLLEGELDVSVLPISQFISSQRGSFNHRRGGLKYRMEQQKRKGYKVPERIASELIDIPIEFKLVQKMRMKLRKYSLNAWQKCRNSEQFEILIDPYKKKLKFYTRIYHKVQQIKKNLGLKTI